MNNESLEVQFARLDERSKMILTRIESNQKETKESREQLAAAFESLRRIDARMERLEESFATSEPTLNEYRLTKQKLLGAGIFGKWIWVALTGTVGLLYTFREHIVTMLTHK